MDILVSIDFFIVALYKQCQSLMYKLIVAEESLGLISNKA